MEPIRETRQVLRRLAEFGDEQTGRQLEHVAQIVSELVPDLVGVSIALVRDGLTLTLVSSAEEIAALDAVQYLDGGPCVAAIERGEVVAVPAGSALDESEWQLHAQATAATGVRSTLSLPIIDEGQVKGGINLYAASVDAFEGHVETIAAVLGSTAAEVVRNADLTFSSRERAQRGPMDLDELDSISRAVGVLASSRGVDASTAEALLNDCAVRSGLSHAQVARALTAFLT